MIGVIAGRELRSLFSSPLAWTVLAVVQFLLAWIFLVHVDNYTDNLQAMFAAEPAAPGVTDMVAGPLYGTAALILLPVVPLLSMRLISEERRSGTLRLLLSSPVGLSQIVLGKYLALVVLTGIMVLFTAAMPASLAVGTSLDWGKLAAGTLGLALMVFAFGAAGLYLSTLTRQPVIAAVATYGLLLLLLMVDWAAGGEDGAGVMEYLSIINHFQGLAQGRVDTTAVAYYLLFIVLFLGLSIQRLDAERLRS